MKNFIYLMAITSILSSCANSYMKRGIGGELVGVGSELNWAEPRPYGMVLVSRGTYTMGPSKIDSLWGITIPTKGVSVDDFWMDDTEITNSEYKQFVFWVRDSIIRERLADPAYGGNEIFKITENEFGEPVTPHLNWEIPIPWSKPTEEEAAAINSLYYIHPGTKTAKLDVKQLNFIYEWFDYVAAAKRQNRLKSEERVLNTDVDASSMDIVMISKDTAYVDDNGHVVNKTINRKLSGLYDFINTKIVNVYPDTTCWINDFPNANNESYMRNYFSNGAYNDYPVVGVSWNQAESFCNWRTLLLKRKLAKNGRDFERYRLPTEAEWEMAARAANSEQIYPWRNKNLKNKDKCFYANFKPGEGAYAADNNVITSKVASYQPNSLGLYDMAGNVSEWTSTSYNESASKIMNDMNPEYRYNAAKEDPYSLKKKVVKGGSWKDISIFIRSDMRDFEYQNQGRSYVGFRCVRTRIGGRK